MSLRVCSRTLPRAGLVPTSARSLAPKIRLASSEAHHDHHEADSETYPSEGFSFSFWRRTILVVASAAAFYKFAPSAEATGEKVNALTEYLTISREHSKRVNDSHLVLSKAEADARILTDGATKPAMIRLRNPTIFENASPHCLPVGQQADLSDLRVKRYGE